MGRKRFGKLAPRYLFALNPYAETRFSKCPKCERLTYPRKFPLLIHVDGFGLVVLGKTCRYCSRCEFIIAHQDELEAELAHAFSRIAADAIGNPYFVLGTVDRKVWRRGMREKVSLEEVPKYTADIKRYTRVFYEPPRWVPST